MVRSLMALVFRRVLAWLVWSDEHAKDLEIVVVPRQNLVRAAKWLTCQLESGENPTR